MDTFLAGQRIILTAPLPAEPASVVFSFTERGGTTKRVAAKVGERDVVGTAVLEPGWWTWEALAAGRPYHRDALYVKP